MEGIITTRRIFLTKSSNGLGIATAASTGIIIAPAIAQSRTKLTIVSTWPRDFPGPGLSAQRISDLSDDRLDVECFVAGERVGAFDSFDEAAAEVFEETRDHSALATKVDDSFQSSLREMSAYLKIAGNGFSAQRNRVLDI